jgi:hypothetical protein
MGTSLHKVFFSIEPLFDSEQYEQPKIITNRIEEDFMLNSKRSINFDPGFLSLYNLMLLSTKNFSHRIPLKEGIYSEVTLIYQKKTYTALPWTYPDFISEPYLEVLLSIRSLYKKQLDNLLSTEKSS